MYKIPVCPFIADFSFPVSAMILDVIGINHSLFNIVILNKLPWELDNDR